MGLFQMPKVSKHPSEAQPARVLEPEVPPTIPGIQPAVLDELNAEERIEWVKFTTRMPPDWFPLETWGMLAQLCRHIVQARWLGAALQEVRAGLLDPTDDDQLDRIEKLIRMHDREGRATTSLMIRMRLTSQQRLSDPRVADRARLKDEHVDETPWASRLRQ